MDQGFVEVEYETFTTSMFWSDWRQQGLWKTVLWMRRCEQGGGREKKGRTDGTHGNSVTAAAYEPLLLLELVQHCSLSTWDDIGRCI